jgi:GMP reductase
MITRSKAQVLARYVALCRLAFFIPLHVDLEMRIETEVKLDFKDVLIRPKRSTLKSRSEVSLARDFTFKHSKLQWSGVPIMAANMDTVGTFGIAEELSKHQLFTCAHKHYDRQDWVDFIGKHDDSMKNYVAVSSGTSDADFQKLVEIMAVTPMKFVCLDVANGYSEFFVQYVRKVRAQFPDVTIIAGNVVTGEMTEVMYRFCFFCSCARILIAYMMIFSNSISRWSSDYSNEA